MAQANLPHPGPAVTEDGPPRRMVESPEGTPSSTILLWTAVWNIYTNNSQDLQPILKVQGNYFPIQFIHWIQLQDSGSQLGDINTPSGPCDQAAFANLWILPHCV